MNTILRPSGDQAGSASCMGCASGSAARCRRGEHELCADAVRDFCDTLGIARPVVYGHSLGGYVAMVYGARHPGHAGALVLQSTNAWFDLGRIVEEFRRAGGDEVAAIVERVYGGDRLSMTAEEWARCWSCSAPG